MTARQRAAREHTRILFSALKGVLDRYRSIWCRDASSNKAIAMFFTSIHLLEHVQQVEDDGPAPYHGPSKNRVMARMLDRVNLVYDRLAQRGIGMEASALALDLPPRGSLPMEERALVEHVRKVDQVLAEHPLVRAALGISEQERILLHATLTQYARLPEEKRLLIQPHRLMGAYQRQLKGCLLRLVSGVDTVIPRYKDYPAFITEYKTARRPLRKLELGSRRTWFVEEVGQVSLRHERALEQWPKELGKGA